MDDWDFWVPGIEGIFGHFGSQSFDLRGLVARLEPKSPPFRHLGRRLFIVLDSCGSKSENPLSRIRGYRKSQLRCEVRSDSVRNGIDD